MMTINAYSCYHVYRLPPHISLTNMTAAPPLAFADTLAGGAGSGEADGDSGVRRCSPTKAREIVAADQEVSAKPYLSMLFVSSTAFFENAAEIDRRRPEGLRRPKQAGDRCSRRYTMGNRRCTTSWPPLTMADHRRLRQRSVGSPHDLVCSPFRCPWLLSPIAYSCSLPSWPTMPMDHRRRADCRRHHHPCRHGRRHRWRSGCRYQRRSSWRHTRRAVAPAAAAPGAAAAAAKNFRRPAGVNSCGRTTCRCKLSGVEFVIANSASHVSI